MNKDNLLNLDSFFDRDEFQLVNKLVPRLNMNYRRMIIRNPDLLENLSKVYVDKKSFRITPKIFCRNPEDLVEVDYIGVYAIGIVELLHNTFSNSSTTDLQEKFIKIFANSISNFNDISDIFNSYNDIGSGKSRYSKAFQIFESMRTDYANSDYDYFIRYASNLMVLFIIDQSTFWKIFFEVLDACFVAVSDIVTLEDDYVKCIKLCNSVDYHYIEYNIPGKDTVRKITNCRSFCVGMCLYLYYHLLMKGGTSQKVTAMPIDDETIAESIHSNIINCIGNDDQSKILRGIHRETYIMYDTNNTFIYNQKPSLYYKINEDISIVRTAYEEICLFCKAYNIKEWPNELYYNKINMHYSNGDSIFRAIGEILYYSPLDVMSKHANASIIALKETLDKNKFLETLISNYQKKIKTIEDTTKAKYETKISKLESDTNKLKEEIERLNQILESKNSIINQISNENKELNAIIVNTYDDDVEIDTPEDISLEDMIDTINKFKLILVGGRLELLERLGEFNIVNTIQLDRDDFNTKFETVRLADFVVINSKFCSHKTVNKVLSELNDNSRVIYFNGTNPRKFIEACYSFITKYFE